AVARVSSPSRKPSTVDTPSASAASITERCETDLSPGISTLPRNGCPAVAIQCCDDCDIPCSIHSLRPGRSKLPACAGDTGYYGTATGYDPSTFTWATCFSSSARACFIASSSTCPARSMKNAYSHLAWCEGRDSIRFML